MLTSQSDRYEDAPLALSIAYLNRAYSYRVCCLRLRGNICIQTRMSTELCWEMLADGKLQLVNVSQRYDQLMMHAEQKNLESKSRAVESMKSLRDTLERIRAARLASAAASLTWAASRSGSGRTAGRAAAGPRRARTALASLRRGDKGVEGRRLRRAARVHASL